jgi:hypothetical protein
MRDAASSRRVFSKANISSPSLFSARRLNTANTPSDSDSPRKGRFLLDDMNCPTSMELGKASRASANWGKCSLPKIRLIMRKAMLTSINHHDQPPGCKAYFPVCIIDLHLHLGEGGGVSEQLWLIHAGSQFCNNFTLFLDVQQYSGDSMSSVQEVDNAVLQSLGGPLELRCSHALVPVSGDAGDFDMRRTDENRDGFDGGNNSVHVVVVVDLFHPGRIQWAIDIHPKPSFKPGVRDIQGSIAQSDRIFVSHEFHLTFLGGPLNGFNR